MPNNLVAHGAVQNNNHMFRLLPGHPVKRHEEQQQETYMLRHKIPVFLIYKLLHLAPGKDLKQFVVDRLLQSDLPLLIGAVIPMPLNDVATVAH